MNPQESKEWMIQRIYWFLLLRKVRFNPERGTILWIFFFLPGFVTAVATPMLSAPFKVKLLPTSWTVKKDFGLSG